MVWWKRFFKKKTEPVEEDDWEQVVYTRNGVNFEEEDQRKRYIVNCLEQITEASRHRILRFRLRYGKHSCG